MTGEVLIRCKRHNTTGADSCPECDKGNGVGQTETRQLVVNIEASVPWLRGELVDGYQHSDTEAGWDDVFQQVQKACNQQFSFPKYCKDIDIRVVEWL